MTLLEIIQEVFAGLGLNKPTAAAQTADTQALQAVALINDEVLALMRDPVPWKSLNKEFTITGVANQTLYPTPADFGYLIDGTQFSRSQHWVIYGPLSPQQWQGWKSSSGRPAQAGLRTRLRETGLEFLEQPGAGSVFVCEYQSAAAVKNGVTYKKRATEDEDTFQFPDALFLLALKWRWLRAKGLNYEHEYDEYMEQLASNRARDNGSTQLSMLPGANGQILINAQNFPESI